MIESVEVVIRQPGFPDRVVPLSIGQTQMGRGDDNEIVLADVGVSRKHAQIVVSATEVSVEDLGSGNGTYYFGHKVSSQPLRDQDEVVIDPFVLHFRIQGGGPAGTGEAPTVAAEPEGPRIEVVVGNGMVGSLFPIGERGLTMGRAEDRDIVVPDPASSRHHCHITPEQGEYVLHDNGSANGVFVNAVRVRECTLSNGDLVRIGNTEMRFVNPAAQVQQLMNAAAQPYYPQAAEPAMDFPIDPRPQQGRDRYADPAASSGGGKGGLLAAFAGLAVVLVIGALALLVLVLVIIVFLVQASAPPAPLPAHAPRWQLTGALPSGTVKELDDQGLLASKAGEHAKAIEYFLAVLKQDPGNNTAAKFAAYSGTSLVVANLESQKTKAARERERNEDLRDSLLAQMRNRRLRDKARPRLEQNFRDDPVVQEAMEWGITQKQINQIKNVDKARDHIELTDKQAEGVRLLRRVLAESNDRELRATAYTLIDKGVEHQVLQIAPSWREAVLAEALGNTTEAKALYQRIINADASNVSSGVRLKAL